MSQSIKIIANSSKWKDFTSSLTWLSHVTNANFFTGEDQAFLKEVLLYLEKSLSKDLDLKQMALQLNLMAENISQSAKSTKNLYKNIRDAESLIYILNLYIFFNRTDEQEISEEEFIKHTVRFLIFKNAATESLEVSKKTKKINAQIRLFDYLENNPMVLLDPIGTYEFLIRPNQSKLNIKSDDLQKLTKTPQSISDILNFFLFVDKSPNDPTTGIKGEKSYIESLKKDFKLFDLHMFLFILCPNYQKKCFEEKKIYSNSDYSNQFFYLLYSSVSKQKAERNCSKIALKFFQSEEFKSTSIYKGSNYFLEFQSNNLNNLSNKNESKLIQAVNEEGDKYKLEELTLEKLNYPFEIRYFLDAADEPIDFDFNKAMERPKTIEEAKLIIFKNQVILNNSKSFESVTQLILKKLFYLKHCCNRTSKFKSIFVMDLTLAKLIDKYVEESCKILGVKIYIMKQLFNDEALVKRCLKDHLATLLQTAPNSDVAKKCFNYYLVDNFEISIPLRTQKHKKNISNNVSNQIFKRNQSEKNRVLLTNGAIPELKKIMEQIIKLAFKNKNVLKNKKESLDDSEAA